MSRTVFSSLIWPVPAAPPASQTPPCPGAARAALYISNASAEAFAAALPFGPDDVTAGSESELQTAVLGDAQCVDLPLHIRHSNFFANVIKHAAVQETPQKAISAIERYLDDNPSQAWENSWVRIPLARFNSFALRVLNEDLRATRSDPNSPPRADKDKFFVRNESGIEYARLPISYVLKLALAQLLGAHDRVPRTIYHTAFRLMDHFINDNCSPETLSFYVTPLSSELGQGRALARETAQRFLLTHLLLLYANETFDLRASGQRALAYYSPLPPLRQRQLNACISDTLYRDLFCSPCLSGWDRGEEKYRYMRLCHEVLSRSQLNAMAKLRDAGIITSNLVVLPNTSNVSLSNNGTHVSLGSLRLKQALENPHSGYGPRQEKYFSDLGIKIAEHFLPLFVGTYSAAPQRLDFADFHPETLLGFLPHQLDYTQLRMLWRQWKEKAGMNVLGYPVSPIGGPGWMDRARARALNLRGDFVPDMRLLDYLVALGSTDQSPALNGELGNSERLKSDLADLGILDARMSFYMFYKPREHAQMGFTGFEGRHYSQFENFGQDLSHAVQMQALISALGYHYIFSGNVRHEHIPDTRAVESERRHIVFAMAVGLPNFYVQGDTGNAFLRNVLQYTHKTRPSHRHRGYLKVDTLDYRQALLKKMQTDAPALIAAHNAQATLDDALLRITQPQASTAGRLTHAILAEAGARSPRQLSAAEFSGAAESYYRGTLHQRFLREALDEFADDVRALETTGNLDPAQRQALRHSLTHPTPSEFLRGVESGVLRSTLPQRELHKLINLLLINIDCATQRAQANTKNPENQNRHATSVCGSPHG